MTYKGAQVRQLDLGHQLAGHYTDKTKAAYWDGRNALGESSGKRCVFLPPVRWGLFRHAADGNPEIIATRS